MNKVIKLLTVFSLGIVVSFFNFNTSALAQKKVRSAVIKKNTKTMVTVKKQRLPDLIVSKIELIKGCKIKITIKNVGLAGVPDAGYHMNKGTSVEMYKKRAPFGGIRLGAIDPRKKLKTPGGSVSHIWFPNASNLDLGPGVHSISVEVDNNNAVKESNEKNNKRTIRLRCKNIVKSGDLSIKHFKCPNVVFAGQKLRTWCPFFVESTFANAINDVAVDMILTSIPTYPVPAPYAIYSPNYSNNVLLKGGRDSIYLGGPGTIQITHNGDNQIPTNTPLGSYYLAAVVDAGNKVTETNEQNNIAFYKVEVIPEPQIPQGPDLSVASIKISNQSPTGEPVPRVLVRIRNLGSSAIPLGTNSKLKVYVDGSLVDTIDLDDSRVEQTVSHDVHNAYDPENIFLSYSTATTNYIFQSGGTYTCEAVIDATNTIAETNESNNSKTRVVVIPDP